MSFGFSVGDFLAVGNLIKEIVTCLKDANGSKSEYQEVVRELKILTCILHHVEHLDSPGPSSAVIDSVKLVALSCKTPLERFRQKVEKYEKSLGQKSDGRGWKNTKGKLQWKLCEQDEVEKLQAYLNTHIAAINALLTKFGLEQMELISQKAEEDRLHVHEKLDRAQGVLATVHQNSTTVATAVGSVATMMEDMFRMVSGEIAASVKTLQNTVVNVCVLTQQIHGAVLEIRAAIITKPQARLSWFQQPYCVEDPFGAKVPVPSEYDFTMIEGVIQLQLDHAVISEPKVYRSFTLADAADVDNLVSSETALNPGDSMVVRGLELLWGLESGPCPDRFCASQKSRPYSERGRICCECGILFEIPGTDDPSSSRTKIITHAENVYDKEMKQELDDMVAQLYPHRRLPDGLEVNLWKSPHLRNSVWIVPHDLVGNKSDSGNGAECGDGNKYDTDFNVEALAEYYGLLAPSQIPTDSLGRWRPAPPLPVPTVFEEESSDDDSDDWEDDDNDDDDDDDDDEQETTENQEKFEGKDKGKKLCP